MQQLFGGRRRIAALLALVAMVVGWVVISPGAASASTGGSARGAGVTGAIDELVINGNTIFVGESLDHAVANTPVPDANGNGSDMNTDSSFSLAGGLFTVGSATGVTVRSTDSLRVGGYDSSVALDLFGIPVVTADFIGSAALCPITELTDLAPSAIVSPIGTLQVNGIDAELESTSDPIAVDIGDPDVNAFLVVFVGQETSTTTTTAEAVGLRIRVAIQGDVLGTPFAFDFIDVAFGQSECTRPDGTAPVADGLSPLSGTEGTTVTIDGSGFIPGATTVQFGSLTIAADDVDVDDDADFYGTSLSFNVPDDAPLGATPVTATTPVGTTSPLNFTVLPAAPTTSGLSPTSGGIGTTVTVNGDNFIPGATSVDFGGTTIPAGSVTVASDGNSLTFAVPLGSPAGATDVTVTTAGGTSTPALSFTVLPVPTASGLSPTSGPVGTTVTVTGTGFVDGSTTVTLGGTTIAAGDVTVASGTSLTFGVPVGSPLGATDVTVTTPGGTSTPALTFTVTLPAPSTTGLSPTSGPHGTVVTVTGDDFIPGATTVSFGSIAIPASSVTVALDGTSLTFAVPDGAALGSTAVVVTTAGGSTAPQSFTVTASRPDVTGVSPGEGPAGTTVTITGDHFIPGGTAVVLGTSVIAPADVTVAADGRSLTFVVPEGVAVGVHDLLVVTVGGTSAASTFTVTEAVVPVTPSGDLPYTGSGSTGPLVLTGFMLLLVGAVVVFAAMAMRRRPTEARVVSAARAGRRRGGRL